MKSPEAIDRALNRMACGFALAGGAVLLVLVAVVCLSALGNAALTLARSEVAGTLAPGLSGWLVGSGIGPIKATYELIETGLGLAAFAFLPWAGLRGAHARVEIFTARLSTRGQRWLDRLWLILLAVALAVVAWRMGVGMAGKLRAAETTFLLRIPVGWAYAACLPAAWTAAVCALWSALRPGDPAQ